MNSKFILDPDGNPIRFKMSYEAKIAIDETVSPGKAKYSFNPKDNTMIAYMSSATLSSGEIGGDQTALISELVEAYNG